MNKLINSTKVTRKTRIRLIYYNLSGVSQTFIKQKTHIDL